MAKKISDDDLERLIARLAHSADAELVSDEVFETLRRWQARMADNALDAREVEMLRSLLARIDAERSGRTTEPTAREPVVLRPQTSAARREADEPSIALSHHGEDADSDQTTDWVFRLLPTDERIEYRQGASHQLSGELYIRLTWLPDDSEIEIALSGSLGVGRSINRSFSYASSAEALESAPSFVADSPDVSTWTVKVDESTRPKKGDQLRVKYVEARIPLEIVIMLTLE